VLKYKLHLPSSIYLLLKALATIQRFAEELHPTISFSETILPYAKNLVMDKYTPKKMVGALYNAIGDYVALIRNFPVEVNEILGKIKDGRLVHEINIHDSKSATTVLRNITRRISMSLLMAALLVCSTILVSNNPENSFAQSLFVATSILAMFLVLRYLFTTKSR